LDPDVNAFVGLLTTFNRFNEALRVGKPADPLTSLWLWTWGADLGIVRGRHLWELDLLGGSLGDHLAFSPGLVGEHQLTHRWMFYHRTFLSLFVGDTVVDSDQGIVWMAGGRFGLSAGYRIFASQHMSRNGPRIGLIFHFQTPKIPFIFPSLG
jgi:hypothetical protein